MLSGSLGGFVLDVLIQWTFICSPSHFFFPFGTWVLCLEPLPLKRNAEMLLSIEYFNPLCALGNQVSCVLS